MSIIMANDPSIAPKVTATSPKIPKELRATPPKLPDSRTIRATPRLAPELIPNTDGPARGLRKTVCISNPLTESPAPAMAAVRDWGMRDFVTILNQIGSDISPSRQIFIIDFRGMETEPRARLSRNSSTIPPTRRMILEDRASCFIKRVGE